MTAAAKKSTEQNKKIRKRNQHNAIEGNSKNIELYAAHTTKIRLFLYFNVCSLCCSLWNAENTSKVYVCLCVSVSLSFSAFCLPPALFLSFHVSFYDIDGMPHEQWNANFFVFKFFVVLVEWMNEWMNYNSNNSQKKHHIANRAATTKSLRTFVSHPANVHGKLNGRTKGRTKERVRGWTSKSETEWSLFVWREIFYEKFVHLLFSGISKPNSNSSLFIHLYPFHVNDSRQFVWWY